MTIEYTIAPIATKYDGRVYRSRLEARWAAFFDRCGWRFEYEPYDLGKWSPDFLLRAWDREILVEVKPINKIDVPTIYKMHVAATETGFLGDLLLLGSGVLSHREIGWICSDEVPTLPLRSIERDPFPNEMKVVPWFVPALSTGNNPADIVPFSFNATRSGHSSDHGMFFHKPAPCELMFSLGGERRFSLMDHWKAASNVTRWRPD